VGNGYEAITLFRRPLEFLRTDIGGTGWRYNNAEVRGIYRLDSEMVDETALVLLSITLP
jgi:hypothetical protein